MTKQIDELMRLGYAWANAAAMQAVYQVPADDAETAFRKALEAALKPEEPVHWEYKHVYDGEDDWQKLIPRTGQTLETALKEIQGYRSVLHKGPMYEVRPLYTAPQAQTPPPRLTADDLMNMPSFDYDSPQGIAEADFARAIETAVRKQFGVNDE